MILTYDMSGRYNWVQTDESYDMSYCTECERRGGTHKLDCGYGRAQARKEEQHVTFKVGDGIVHKNGNGSTVYSVLGVHDDRLWLKHGRLLPFTDEASQYRKFQPPIGCGQIWTREGNFGSVNQVTVVEVTAQFVIYALATDPTDFYVRTIPEFRRIYTI